MYDPFAQEPRRAIRLAQTSVNVLIARCALRMASEATEPRIFSVACEEFAVELTQLEASIEWLYRDPMYAGFKHAIAYWRRRAVEARDQGDVNEFVPAHAEMFLRLARSIVEVAVRVANTPDVD